MRIAGAAISNKKFDTINQTYMSNFTNKKPHKSVCVSFKNNQSVIPRVAVIDEFKIPTIDINSDGIKDLPHGCLVEAIIKSIVNADTVEFSNNNKIKILTDFIPEQLQKVEEEGNFDAVNISAGLSKSLRILRSKLNIPELNKDNLHRYREDIRQYYLDTKEDNVYKVIEAVENVTAKGIPVYFAAGNKGSDYVNLFGVARGAINVGAVNTKNVKVITSAENSMLEYDRGIYGVSKILDKIGNILGYNVSGTDKVEFTPNEISSGKPRVEQYIGKSIKNFLASAKEYEIKKIKESNPSSIEIDENTSIKDALFSVKGLAKKDILKPQELNLLLANGYDYVTFDNKLHFSIDKDKNIQYDPDGSHRQNLVGAIRGTSFASPAALAHDLLKNLRIKKPKTN
ncbi:MAG: hypothetical protein WCK67_09715 [bacterium]